jgi:hypothetical protein
MFDTTDTPATTNAPPSWLYQRMPRLLLFGGLLVVLLWYGIAQTCGLNSHPATTQTDALVYLQYAQAIADGHPYVYSAGDAPSTGSTSHLYPALLAIPCALGLRGTALLSAAFVISALAYLIWLQLFWQVARRIAPRQAVLAAALALCNGHLLLAVSGLTDMALFTALAWGVLAALLYERHRLAGVLLLLSIFTRPEGMLLAIGLTPLAAYRTWQRATQAKPMCRLALTGLLGVAIVFTLNFALTGVAQFQSVAQKGYLINYPLLGALGCIARDFTTLVRETWFNLGAAPRHAYFLPGIGGLLAILGALRLPEQATAVWRWWLVCAGAAFLLIAMSTSQGSCNDRYLLWLLPTWYLLAACGAGWLAETCRTPRLFHLLTIALLGYELASWPYFAARLAADGTRTQSVLNFGREAAALLPADATVGVISGPCLATPLAPRPVRHLFGITSPAFAAQRDMLCAIETMKYHPETRFSHLALTDGEAFWCAQAGILGAALLTSPDAPPDGDAYTLYHARFDSFPPAAHLPLDPAIRQALHLRTLTDQLDIGYLPDERRCQYRTAARLAGLRCRPCVANRAINNQRLTEVGQPVLGWDEFHVRVARTNSPVFVVLRTMLTATCTVIRTSEKYTGEGLHLQTPLQLRPIVNNQLLPVLTLTVDAAPDTFTEGLFAIPAAYVTTDPLEIVLAGDHIALAYWFYQ